MELNEIPSTHIEPDLTKTNHSNISIRADKLDDLTNEMSKNITILTHNGKFHIDDVGAVSLLSTYYSEKGMKVHIARSRNEDLISSADVVVDVGNVYDHDQKRYDHHQFKSNEKIRNADNSNKTVTFDDDCHVPMSSIGMIWKHYGKELLKMYMGSKKSFSTIASENDHIDKLHKEIYYKIVLELDSHDNGMGDNYSRLSLINIISCYNSFESEVEQMRRFKEAATLFGQVFEIMLENIITKYISYSKDLNIVKNLIVNVNKPYIVLNSYISTIYKCLSELDPECKIKFIIIINNENSITVKTRGKKYNITTPIIPLLSETKAQDKLNDDLIFIHRNRFIGKVKTLNAAVCLVELSIENNEKSVKFRNDQNLKSRNIVSSSTLLYYGFWGLVGITSFTGMAVWKLWRR